MKVEITGLARQSAIKQGQGVCHGLNYTGVCRTRQWARCHRR
jgi:hypothetical protein